MPNRIVQSPRIGPTADDVRRRLLEQISSGALQPGQRLGAERDLSVEYGVSRSSLRQALAALESDGVVRRIPGRGGGTFVSSDKVDRDLSRIVGVPALLRDQGFTAGSKVMSAAVVAADEATAKALRIQPGSFVCDVVRIRLADGLPISLEHARFPAERFPGLLEQSLGGSLYELLETQYGVRPAEAEERIEVVSATADEGLILGVAEGAPLLSITRTAADGEGVPIETAHDLFRADRTRLTVRTRGQAATASSAVAGGKLVELKARAY
jgi:GntR family transcriptional regulator